MEAKAPIVGEATVIRALGAQVASLLRQAACLAILKSAPNS